SSPHSPCTFTFPFPFQPYCATRTLAITSNHGQHHSISLLNPSLEPAQPLFNSDRSSSTVTRNTTKQPPRSPHNHSPKSPSHHHDHPHLQPL
ncbi:unnamed protein product, partial [Sphenostylis stenocarpa]